MDDRRESIRQLLHEILERNNDTRGFSDTDSLILSGRFQSLDVLEIVVFLSKNGSASTSRTASISRASIPWKKS